MGGFSIGDGLIKSLTDDIPVSKILIILGTGGTIMFAGLAISQGKSLYSPQMRNKAFAVRFTSDIFFTLFFLPALALIPLAKAASILQAIPILVTMGATLVLGQKVGWRRWRCGCESVQTGKHCVEQQLLSYLVFIRFGVSRSNYANHNGNLAFKLWISPLSTGNFLDF